MLFGSGSEDLSLAGPILTPIEKDPDETGEGGASLFLGLGGVVVAYLPVATVTYFEETHWGFFGLFAAKEIFRCGSALATALLRALRCGARASGLEACPVAKHKHPPPIGANTEYCG